MGSRLRNIELQKIAGEVTRLRAGIRCEIKFYRTGGARLLEADPLCSLVLLLYRRALITSRSLNNLLQVDRPMREYCPLPLILRRVFLARWLSEQLSPASLAT